MIEYIDYLDETGGVAPEKNHPSFNNILYSYYLLLGLKLSGKLKHQDVLIYENHINQNLTKEGLYKPKSSHDNMTAFYLALRTFVLYYDRDGFIKYPNLLLVWWNIGLHRIWDVLLYWYISSGFYGRLFLTPFMILPCLLMISACYEKKTIRPELHERIWLRLQGKSYETRLVLNSGKPLSVIKLNYLKNKGFIFKITANICKKILVKRYGVEFMHELLYILFNDKNHPAIAAWKGIKDPI